MTIVYGWIGNQELYDLLKNEFNDNEQKSLNQLLNYQIETKNIIVKSGFNKILPKDYDDLKKKDRNNKVTDTKTNNEDTYKLSSEDFTKLIVDPIIKAIIAKKVTP